MNPQYPVNGSPYPHHPQHPQQHPQPPMGPGAPGMPPGPHQYAPYPMHPNPYSHPYPGYPQYPPQMMMYPPPRQGGIPEPQHQEPQSAPVQGAGNKRKRKGADAGRSKAGERGSDDETGASGSDAPRQTLSQKQQAQAASDLKKRTKTVRPPSPYVSPGLHSLCLSSSNVHATLVAVEKFAVMLLQTR